MVKHVTHEDGSEYLRNRQDDLNHLTVFNLLSGQIIRIIHLKQFWCNICNELWNQNLEVMLTLVSYFYYSF